MNIILTLTKLEFRGKFSGFSATSKKSWAKLAFGLLFYAALLYVIYAVGGVLFRMFDKAGIAYEALVIIFTILFIILLITGISSTIKVLYYKGDNLILMRFPVSGSEIFISKTLFLAISQFVTTATIVVPVLLAYANVIPVGQMFYNSIPVSVLFLVLIPFLLSNILAIPIMHLTNKIRNKFGLIIILLSILVAGMFAIYMFLFSKVVDFMKNDSFSVFSPEFVYTIQQTAKYLIPTKYFADILLHNEMYFAYPALIILTGISLAGMILVINLIYQKTLLGNIEIEGSAFVRKTKNKKKSIFAALLCKEFIQVFRSVNYSFQYFVLAVAMPVMVYFCNSIALKLGENTIGEQISVGMTLLVMLIFATVITSFSATSVTREGNNFYHTKIMPVPIRTQLLAKFVMYLLVSLTANLICVFILIVTKMMEANVAWWVFGIVQMLSIGITLRSMRYDIKKPHFNLSGEGEVVNATANTTASVLLGFVVAVTVGMLSMVTAYMLSLPISMIICTLLSVLIFLYCVAVYSINLKKTYEKIVK
ncbi:MAG: hypothetical protein WC292_01335 [Clostridia bacterium]